MNRRGFLQGILAAGIAPAFIGSSVLMPLRKLWLPPGLRTATIGGVSTGPLFIVTTTHLDSGIECEVGFYGADRNQPVSGIKLAPSGGVIHSDDNIRVAGRWA